MAKGDTPKELVDALDLVSGEKALKLESLSGVETREVRRVRTIFEDPNIVAIGISQKISEKENTGELGVCFYVEKKLARSKMKNNKMIPPVLSVADRKAVFTDVQQIGKVRPQINKRKSPLLSGFSVGSSIDTGTLGAIVKKGKKLFVLSNSHVLARSGLGKVGDKIIFPGKLDNGGRDQVIATLSAFLKFKTGDDFLNRVDAALAEIDEDFLEKIDFSIRGTKAPLATTVPVRGMKIVTRGRTSGDTEGEVQDVHFRIVLPYQGVGQVGFLDQVKCSHYSKGGDSGALIVDKTSKKIVGLHFAGSPIASIFNPIAEVVKALKFRFVAA
ncbi:hypothetical protein [Bradyrhizobium sp. JYMT SZCCT0428]|uniref:hypothetical protein n=1 Tax=Bradyrhizobium sp. JYMT SZCCT0428 TaxID=2807673 RepID=UPI001BA4BC01|nr:hypothetical protein [Bradyrhizobium sp. JYMT SZCCT0428]MBR1152456.1 hypothetical protein [Bradyrhizobium sp. JYMT SZCCT0428]